MSDIKNIFDISGRAMSAQLTRLNTVASNLANANNVSGSIDKAYRAIKPVFETKFSDSLRQSGIASVDAVQIKEVNRVPEKVYMPEHPQANDEGFIFNAEVEETVEVEAVETVEAAEEVKITRTEKTKVKKSKEKPVAVEPLTPEELKQIISQSKENEDDDCLMCGS